MLSQIGGMMINQTDLIGSSQLQMRINVQSAAWIFNKQTCVQSTILNFYKQLCKCVHQDKKPNSLFTKIESHITFINMGYFQLKSQVELI